MGVDAELPSQLSSRFRKTAHIDLFSSNEFLHFLQKGQCVFISSFPKNKIERNANSNKHA